MTVLFLTGQREQRLADPRKILLDIGGNDVLYWSFATHRIQTIVKQGHRQHNLRAAVLELVGPLGGRESRVEGDDNRTGLENPEESDHKLGGIWQGNGDPVALLDR